MLVILRMNETYPVILVRWLWASLKYHRFQLCIFTIYLLLYSFTTSPIDRAYTIIMIVKKIYVEYSIIKIRICFKLPRAQKSDLERFFVCIAYVYRFVDPKLAQHPLGWFS